MIDMSNEEFDDIQSVLTRVAALIDDRTFETLNNNYEAMERNITHLEPQTTTQPDRTLTSHTVPQHDYERTNTTIPIAAPAPNVTMINNVIEINEGDDDDLIFVGVQRLPPRSNVVIDLCSPATDIVPNSRRRSRKTTTTSARDRSRSSISANTATKQPIETQPQTNKSAQQQGVGADCSICLENILNRQPTTTTCGHMFCKACIHEAIRIHKCCPTCKRRLTVKQTHSLYFN